jgi:hypothetical protein
VAARSSRAAAAPDGRAGTSRRASRAGIDLTTRLPVGAANLRGAPGALRRQRDGVRLYAAARGAIDVIDAATFAVLRVGPAPARVEPTSLAVSGDGTRAAATIDRRHVMIASLERFVPLKRVEVTNPGAVAFAPGSARRVGVLARRARRAARALRPGGPFRARYGVAAASAAAAHVLADRPPARSSARTAASTSR